MKQDEGRKRAAMKIGEVRPGGDMDFVKRIIGPFRLGRAQRKVVFANFRRELGEIGKNRLVLVGEVDGDAAATVQLVLDEADNDPDLADGRTVAHVHNLWVRKDLQGRGYAKRMMKWLEARARRLGFQTLTLGVDDYNVVACGLYRSLGYAEFKREEGRSPGEELLLMRKRIKVDAAGSPDRRRRA
jgi:ribosomal protein S18 acetylase RimI-like enzyme